MLTITRPAARALLTTPAAVRRYLGLGPESEEELLQALIAQATSAISRYCARVFAQEEVEEILRLPPPGYAAITLKRYPIVSFDGLYENGTEVPFSELRLDKEYGVVVRQEGSLLGEILVRYTGGYQLPDPGEVENTNLPSDLEQACLELVRVGWYARLRDPFLQAEKIPEIYEVNYLTPANILTPGVQALLDPWRSLGL